MSAEHFQIAYDGEAVRDGSMDVYDLAPALLAAGDLVKEANRLLNGANSSATVKVDSDFKKGSFEVGLLLNQTPLSHIAGTLFGHITDAESLVKIVFGGGTGTAVTLGIIKVYKALKGEKPKKDGGTTIVNGVAFIQTGSGNSIANVDASSAELYNNDAVRGAVRRILRPLDVPGIEFFEARKGTEVLDRVTKGDIVSIHEAQALALSTSSIGPPKISHRETVLRVIRPSFKHGNNYYVSEGNNEFYVSIEDESFLSEVDRDDVSFSAHGRLEVLLRQETTTGEKTDEVKHIVERAVYIPPPKQLSLTPSEDPGPPKLSQ